MRSKSARSLEQIHAVVVAELRLQRSEIARALHAHICNVVPDRAVDNDDEYQEHLAATVDALVEYGLEAIERVDEALPIPSQALDQARYAARAGVSLGVVLRRYQTGYRKLVGRIAEEAERLSYPPGHVRRHLIEIYGPLIERLTAAVECAFVQEHERIAGSLDRRRREIVQKLLAYEPVEPAELAELNYELNSRRHLGMIATGADASETLQYLKRCLGCELLFVQCGDVIWAWFGRERVLTGAECERFLGANRCKDVWLAAGESERDIDGWRLTHWQAQAAQLVAQCRRQVLTRYVDVALEAAMLRHTPLAKLLIERYLHPLDRLRIGGRVARETLRAYFDTGYNVNKSAETVGVDRRTVWYRIDKVEKQLGCPIAMCHAELEVALRLEDILACPSPTE